MRSLSQLSSGLLVSVPVVVDTIDRCTLLRYIARAAQYGCRINMKGMYADSQASCWVLSPCLQAVELKSPRKRCNLSQLDSLVGPRLGSRQPRISLTFHREKQLENSQKISRVLPAPGEIGTRAACLLLRVVSAFVSPDRYSMGKRLQ